MGFTEQNYRQKPLSLAAALAVNGAIIGAIMLSPMVVNPPEKPPRTEATTVTAKPLPPPAKADDKVEPPPFDPIFTPQISHLPPITPDPMQTTERLPDTIAGAVAGDGKSGDAANGGGDTIVEKIPEVIFKKALRDMRFASDFQPVYPPSLLVREIEGSATISVLVGVDGRVRDARVVSATHPDFGRSAMRQALKAWRFKPATRNGEPVEDWITVPVTFQIN